ncbi:MAG: TlpA family protein disulfide reductase [Labilithrix sp.]|nr:TlpA family protein disulfide reductase [Labilithrix sp.]
MSAIGRWQAWRLRRATRVDVAAGVVLVVLAALCISFGRKARSSPTPRASVENARVLDELELPPRLPNAPVTDATGTTVPLLDRMKNSRAAVAFYAPWCGPCQEELPELVGMIGPSVELFVVISADEDREHTARQLANIGLSHLGFYVDTTGALQREGRVTSLPTTFAISKRGQVLVRAKGYSFGGIFRIRQKLGAARDFPEDD